MTEVVESQYLAISTCSSLLCAAEQQFKTWQDEHPDEPMDLAAPDLAQSLSKKLLLLVENGGGTLQVQDPEVCAV